MLLHPSFESDNICIIGPGAVGIALAVLFGRSFHVHLLGRSANPDFRELPLIVQGSRSLELSPDSYSFDLLEHFPLFTQPTCYWVCVKAHQLDSCLQFLRSHLRADDLVVIVSNGLSIFMQASEVLRRETPILRVLGGFGAKKVSCNTVQLSGELQGLSATLLEDEEILRGMVGLLKRKFDIRLSIEKDIATAEWKKALTNIVVNTICTLADAPNGILLKDLSLQDQARQAYAEALSIAAAEGFDFEDYSFEAVLRGIENHQENINSTLQDVRAGRPTEIEFILGRALRIAECYDVSTPVCQDLYSRIKRL